MSSSDWTGLERELLRRSEALHMIPYDDTLLEVAELPQGPTSREDGSDDREDPAEASPPETPITPCVPMTQTVRYATCICEDDYLCTLCLDTEVLRVAYSELRESGEELKKDIHKTAVPLFFVIMCLYLSPRFVFGPDTKSFFDKLYKDVAHRWWYMLLMIRNYVEITAWDVLPHTWYLSVDFQLFAISLVVLLVFKNRKMLAVGAFLLLSLVGCAIGTWAVAGSDLLPFMIFPGPILQVMSKTVDEYYLRPYYHAVCYFSGSVAYLLIDEFRQRKISKTVQVIGWGVSMVCALLCVFVKLAWYRSMNPTSEAVKLLAAFLDRMLWAVSLSWITLACSSGRGGFVGKFLSWNAFVPLSKLSYGVYLIHLPFIELLLHASRERVYWSIFNTNVLSSGRCSVSVWGAISKDGLGPLVRIEGTFNASSYCDIVKETLVPYAQDGPFPDGFYWLQHDRSPVHTARLAEAALDSCGVLRLPWPPSGADLNPIENVWGLLKRRLAAQSRRLPNADALWSAIQEAWEALSREPETSRALYASMPRRIAEVIAAEGHYTGH
ncbi:hypothetical protein HPB50_026721 [Hyalomma asiaticum]|uniref:Uncharacterized protein n=1 Tax=Hyalomma asiaticum TaxID=266040 RepID=A0ACB7SIX7_HYAAI|nr:hypothetical protein HPB50_026721 [Hyalomma asiaticum]